MFSNTNQSSLVCNLYELDQLPFLKFQTHSLLKFKDKEGFLPLMRALSYRASGVMSKIFVFGVVQQKKNNKLQKMVNVVSEKEVILLQQLFQLLNDSYSQQQFSQEVQKIKEFQKLVYKHINHALTNHFLTFQDKTYLQFGVYKQKQEYYIKAHFKNLNFQPLMEEANSQSSSPPEPFKITNYAVKSQLDRKYMNLLQLPHSSTSLGPLYAQFYDKTQFLYDQFILQLQVLHNYPLLRFKNYLPIFLKDGHTGQPLVGPIFSNADQQCMFSHFIGYNADTVKTIQGTMCQQCQVPIEQMQQNQLLMMLRDNVFNPENCNVMYCSEFNRFKIIKKELVIVDNEEDQIGEEVVQRTKIGYLNYYHLRNNLKRVTNKNRIGFTPTQNQEVFPLTFNLHNKNIMIIDPARGRYCRHFAYTDLRLYYLNFDRETNLYTCPIQGCQEKMSDLDILYLKEVLILTQYAQFKCEQNPELTVQSRIMIDNNENKLFLSYKAKQHGILVNKIEEIGEFYKTLVDPFVCFPEYTLELREKQRKKRMEDYMFAGMKEEMQAEQEMQQEDEEY